MSINRESDEHWWDAPVSNVLQLEFIGTPAGDLLDKLSQVQSEAGLAYYIEEIYLGLRNPIKFFGSLIDFQVEYLMSEFLGQVLSRVSKDGVRFWIEECLAKFETPEQKQFHITLMDYLVH